MERLSEGSCGRVLRRVVRRADRSRKLEVSVVRPVEIPGRGLEGRLEEAVTQLAAAGIRAELDGEALRLRFALPEEPSLELARAVPHPWLRERELSRVGVVEELPEYARLWAANSRLTRMLESDYPEALIGRWIERLEERAREYLDVLLRPEHLRFSTQVLFSGRAVIACGPGLRLDQVSLPDEIAWTTTATLTVFTSAAARPGSVKAACQLARPYVTPPGVVTSKLSMTTSTSG